MENSNRLTVEVLLREYDTLRTEILARVRTRFELLGFLAVIAVFAGSQDTSGSVRATVALFAVATAVVTWAWFAAGIKRCAIRILKIEESVNSLIGDELMQWEASQRRDSWWRRTIR